MEETMFLCLGSAIATSSNSKYPNGEKHAIIVLVLASETDEVRARSIDHMESIDWKDVVIEKIAELVSETLNTQKPEIVSAYEDALDKGVHALVFSDAIE